MLYQEGAQKWVVANTVPNLFPESIAGASSKEPAFLAIPGPQAHAQIPLSPSACQVLPAVPTAIGRLRQHRFGIVIGVLILVLGISGYFVVCNLLAPSSTDSGDDVAFRQDKSNRENTKLAKADVQQAQRLEAKKASAGEDFPRPQKPNSLSSVQLRKAFQGTFEATSGKQVSITFTYPAYRLNPSKDYVWTVGNKGTWEIYTDHTLLSQTDKAKGVLILEMTAPDAPNASLPSHVTMLVGNDGLVSQITFQTYLGIRFPSDKFMVLKRITNKAIADEKRSDKALTKGHPSGKPKPIDVLFPVYGVTLGKTTVDELARLGKRVDGSSNKDKFFDVNGINFWHERGVAIFMCVTKYDTIKMPPLWDKAGFDFSTSYDGWVKLFTDSGWSNKVLKQPKAVKHDFLKHASLQAEIQVISDEIDLLLNFDYGAGDTTAARNTLYSISIDSPRNQRTRSPNSGAADSEEPNKQSPAVDAPPGFSSNEWDLIVQKAKQLGFARNRADTAKLAPALQTMKSVFVQAGIVHPSPNQLFNGVKALTGGSGFVSLSSEKTNESLRETIATANLTGTPVATRQQLERLEYTSQP